MLGTEVSECYAENNCDYHFCDTHTQPELPTSLLPTPIHHHEHLHQWRLYRDLKGCPSESPQPQKPPGMYHGGLTCCQKQGGGPSLCNSGCLDPPTAHPLLSDIPQVRKRAEEGAYTGFWTFSQGSSWDAPVGIRPVGLIAHTISACTGVSFPYY